MAANGNANSPGKEAVTVSNPPAENIPRDFSRLSLFSSTSSTSQDEQFRSNSHAEHSLSCMQNYLQAGKLCDVTLVAGSDGKKVVAHRYSNLFCSVAQVLFNFNVIGSVAYTNSESQSFLSCDWLLFVQQTIVLFINQS